MSHYETHEQFAVMQWAGIQKMPNGIDRVGDYLIAIPNEGKRHPMVGHKMKRMGLKAGVSDLFLAYPVRTTHGLWIEMKKQKRHFDSTSQAINAVRPTQQEWIDRMNEVGFIAKVCYGSHEAIETIKIYLGLR